MNGPPAATTPPPAALTGPPGAAGRDLLPSLLQAVDARLQEQARFDLLLQTVRTRDTPEAVETGMTDLCATVARWAAEWRRVGTRAPFGIGGVLHWVELHWSDLAPIREAYETFADFARDATSNAAYPTYRQWMQIYRVYVLNEFNRDFVRERVTDLLDVPLGKLQKALAVLRRGEPDEALEAALLDANVGDHEFLLLTQLSPEERRRRAEPRAEGDDAGGEDDENDVTEWRTKVVWDTSTGDLKLWKGGMALRFGRIDPTTEPTVRTEIDRIIAAAGIEVQ
jgi:hypothetical protein